MNNVASERQIGPFMGDPRVEAGGSWTGGFRAGAQVVGLASPAAISWRSLPTSHNISGFPISSRTKTGGVWRNVLGWIKKMLIRENRRLFFSF